MEKAPSRSLLYFFFASIFAVMAQSFLLVPQLQGALLEGIQQKITVFFAIALLVGAYLNLALVFYQHTDVREKVVGGISALLLLCLAFLYLRTAFYVEALLLFFMAAAIMFILWQNKFGANYLGRTSLWLNMFIGIAFFFPKTLLAAHIYRPALPLHLFFGSLFLFTALLKLFADRNANSALASHSTKLLAFPWIGWAFLFGMDIALPLLIPALLFSFSLLSFGLLPYNKFRLPDNEMLGHSVFPLLSLLFSFLLAIFSILRNAVYKEFPVGEFLFLLTLVLSAVFIYALMRAHYLLYQLADHPLSGRNEHVQGQAFDKLVKFLFAPFQELQPLTEWQATKIQRLSKQLIIERENSKRFDMLSLLRNQLDESNEKAVTAQLVVKMVAKYFDADLVGILLYDIESRELKLYALDGKAKAYVPADYCQSIDVGTLGRAARLQKMQIINDTSVDRDYISLQDESIASEVFIPLLQRGNLKGILMTGVKKKGAFSAADIRVLEAVAQELLKRWEYSSHDQRMRNLIQSSISLSTSLDPQSAVEEITKVARDTLLARFLFVTLLDQDGTFTRVSSLGQAPKLLQYISQDLYANPLLKIALASKGTLRIRDVSRYKNIPEVPIDQDILRGVMMMPIRLHGVNIGAIMAFGKEDSISFSEKDEALADLLATQAAAAIESSWLIQELRVNSSTTNLLYNLSIEVIQTDTIREAARLIAETAQHLTQSSSVGIILFSIDRKVETALELGKGGQLSQGNTIPLQFVEQTLVAGEAITISIDEDTAIIYLPIQTSLRKYGVLWIEFYDSERQAVAQTQTLKTLANQASMALERAMLLVDLRRKADELKEALEQLENTYDQTLIALMAALDARDHETEGHSSRVGNIACRIGTEFGLDTKQLSILRRGAFLHDIGKIGVSDNILHKPGPLTNEEWRIMRQHPEIGARIVRGIPFLAETMPVIRYHHERWNGSGYPLGLAGDEIPITARIFAVADVFDALTSIRPYRDIASHEEAFVYLQSNAGILFDPEIVAVFDKLLKNGEIESLVCE